MNLIFTSPLYGKVGCLPYPVSAGATEALEFYTDVLKSMTNNSEERWQLRALPRQYFKYQLPASYGFQQEIFNALRSNLRGKWLVPLWFEAQPVEVIGGQTVLDADTLLHDLRAESHALLFKSICEWQIVEISAVTATEVTCTASQLSGLTYLVPLRLGKLADNTNLAPTGYNNTYELQYIVDDVLTGLTEAPPQLNGLDLYTTPYLVDGDAARAKILWDDELSDYVVGHVSSDTTWTRSKYQRGYFFDDQGPAAYRALKNYFYRRAGRYRPFYSPTFESDLHKRSSGLITNTFQFKDDGYNALLFPTLPRLGFELADGSWLVREATAVATPDVGLSQVTLDAPLNVDAKDVHRVSLVLLNRLDTDRLEIELGQNGRFTASASVVEVPDP